MHYEKFQDGTVKCIEDEIPFEVPEGWCWVRVRDIAMVKGGKRLPKGASFSEEITTHAYIRVTDMKNHSVNISNLRYISDEIFSAIKNYTIAKDDLYVTIAGTIGVVGEIPDKLDGMNLTENAVKITNIAINKSFLCIILQTDFVQQQFQNKTHQVAMPKLALERILSTLIPICPYVQQLQIVDRFQICDNFLSTIDTEKEELQKIVSLSKYKILDLAIRGKLVPQDPNDEPASVILERIRTEKEELIKQGKIKRDKKESVIFKGDDNSYYEKIGDNVNRYVNIELPQGWSIGSFSQLNMFQSLNIDPRTHPDKLFELYSVPNWEIGKPEILAGKEIGSSKQSICENDVLVCKINPRLNRVWVCEHTTPHYLLGSSEWIVFRNSFLDSRYVELYFSSPYFRKLLLSNVSGVGGSLMRAQPESVKKYPILIPPYQEQLRIVKQVSHMLEQLNAIKQSVH